MAEIAIRNRSFSITRRELLVLGTTAPILFADNEKSIIGAGWGLDHIEIALSSGEAARETYSKKLGFTVAPDSSAGLGVQHSGIFLGGPYIEFLWLGGPGQPQMDSPPGLQFRRSLDHGGGIFQYNIDVSDIERLHERLRGIGLGVDLQARTRIRNGKEEPAPWRFLFAVDNRSGTVPPPGVPGGDAVGIIEYNNNSDPARMEFRRRSLLSSDLPKDSRRAAGEDHANSARQLRSVWVAVPDVSAAVKESEAFGFAVMGKTKLSAIGAVGQQVACGQGSIEFWEPAGRDGQLASLLKQKGSGPFGFSVGVASLQRSHELAQDGFQTKLAIENQSDRKSVTVSGKLTGGVWVEFVQS
jgi:hypothetical protein